MCMQGKDALAMTLKGTVEHKDSISTRKRNSLATLRVGILVSTLPPSGDETRLTSRA